MKTVLVTGAAGFIGFYTAKRLLDLGYTVIGIDNINNYYDVTLKYDRLNELGIDRSEAEKENKTVQSVVYPNFQFSRINLEDRVNLPLLFTNYQFDSVVNLAAQAGVRYSIENPMAYVDSNIVGFVNLLECMRQSKVSKLLYASSSSVYGNSAKVPFSVESQVDHPISLYAATKKSNELMAHTYSHLFGIQTVGLRFFTVYGPWGRPDMAMFLFTDAIIHGKPIKVFNDGNLSRDFTYIDDIVDGLVKILISDGDSENYQLFNIGNSAPVRLLDFITEIENATGLEAQKIMYPMQPGDVNQTWADVENLKNKYGYNATFSIKQGVAAFVAWYKSYYSL